MRGPHPFFHLLLPLNVFYCFFGWKKKFLPPFFNEMWTWISTQKNQSVNLSFLANCEFEICHEFNRGNHYLVLFLNQWITVTIFSDILKAKTQTKTTLPFLLLSNLNFIAKGFVINDNSFQNVETNNHSFSVSIVGSKAMYDHATDLYKLLYRGLLTCYNWNSYHIFILSS